LAPALCRRASIKSITLADLRSFTVGNGLPSAFAFTSSANAAS
jgi:hypothetical protein